MSLATKKVLPGQSDLTVLMDLYEQNYQRLCRLIPERPIPYDEAVSSSAADRKLHLTVLERTRYTSIIRLTYWFDDADSNQADPNMEIRLFHDAELAEVLACEMHPRRLSFGDFDFEKHSALQAKWGRNLFLNKWLDYLLTHGHGFSTAHRPRLHHVS